ncbi:MAG: hypothetical protein U0841_26890 [Chloroflexia bacterium]
MATRAPGQRLANFCFLTQDTNLVISDRDPAEYFAEVEQRHPGALASQWVPLDRELWKIENYRDFLKARQALLANAANQFLNGLLISPQPIAVVDYPTDISQPGIVVSETETEEEEILALCAWLEERGLPWPELNHEVADLSTGEVRAIIDAAWPRGIQEGFSQPVALLLNEEQVVEDRVSAAGYRFFTSTSALRSYIENEIEHVPVDLVGAMVA